MIINYDFYYCNKCQKSHSFDTSKEYSKLCPDCNEPMEFTCNANGNTELSEQRKNQTPIVPSSRPTITCPYCQSTNTKKISTLSKAGSVAFLGIFALGKTTKQWHCNNCKSDF